MKSREQGWTKTGAIVSALFIYALQRKDVARGFVSGMRKTIYINGKNCGPIHNFCE
jgi:hypothetical protein